MHADRGPFQTPIDSRRYWIAPRLAIATQATHAIRGYPLAQPLGGYSEPIARSIQVEDLPKARFGTSSVFSSMRNSGARPALWHRNPAELAKQGAETMTIPRVLPRKQAPVEPWPPSP